MERSLVLCRHFQFRWSCRFGTLATITTSSYPTLPSFCCINSTKLLHRYYHRLAACEWFTVGVSSCSPFHIAYPSATKLSKIELSSIYNVLGQDGMPMVRRSTNPT